MKKLSILSILSILFIISFTSALDNQGVGTQGEGFTFIQTCDDATYITLSTIQFPNRTVQVVNTNMTSVGGGAFQYNFTDTVIGRYDITGISNGCTKTFATYFEITPTGFILKTSDSITYIILTGGSTLLFLLCLYGGLILPFRNRRDEGGIISVDKLKYFKVGLLFMSYVLFMWLLNLLLSLSTNFSILTQYTKFFEVIFSVMNVMSYPIFVFMLILMSIIAWKDLQLKKLLERGFSPG